jgi:hypothetical protein
MNATIDPTATEVEREAPANRMKGYFAANKPKRQLPKTPQERHELLSDCVMEAILAARDLLNDEDKSVVLKAAETILKVERTRIRHDRNVSGCIPPLQKIDPSLFEEQEDAERPKSHSHAEHAEREEYTVHQKRRRAEAGTSTKQKTGYALPPLMTPTYTARPTTTASIPIRAM